MARAYTSLERALVVGTSVHQKGTQLLVAAPTGSGKTAAFSLPILELVHEKLKEPEAPAAVKEAAVTKEAPPPTGPRRAWRRTPGRRECLRGCSGCTRAPGTARR